MGGSQRGKFSHTRVICGPKGEVYEVPKWDICAHKGYIVFQRRGIWGQEVPKGGNVGLQQWIYRHRWGTGGAKGRYMEF